MFSLGSLPYKRKTLLEDVQKFACKVCCKNWHMDYESMLTHLNILSLQQRRLQLKANMIHQFVHGTQLVHFVLVPPQDMTLEPVLIFLYPLARTNAYYHSFFRHMSRFWNSLPPYIVEAPSNLALKLSVTMLYQ